MYLGTARAARVWIALWEGWMAHPDKPRARDGRGSARAERCSIARRLSTAATGRAQVLEAVSTADQILDANLERLARSPADLASLVRSVEAALARREAQGRPLLL